MTVASSMRLILFVGPERQHDESYGSSQAGGEKRGCEEEWEHPDYSGRLIGYGVLASGKRHEDRFVAG